MFKKMVLHFFQHEMIHAYLFVTDNNKVSNRLLLNIFSIFVFRKCLQSPSYMDAFSENVIYCL